jgi:phosphoglycerate dehydrogenase-like enzyme
LHILLIRSLPESAVAAVRRVAPGADVRVAPAPTDYTPLLDTADVIFGNPPAAVLSSRPRLRWLQLVSAGFDEYAPLAGCPVTVTTAHGVHSGALAQQILMAMLMFSRGQLHFAECQRAGKWDRNPAVPFRLRGQTVGFIGFGAIARELVRFTTPLGLRAIAVKRTPAPCPPELAHLGQLAEVDHLLSESDHVVVTLPLTPETKGILDARRIALLKHGAFFYNVARGGLTDEAALIARLRDGSLGGAALDVFAREPLPADSEWWTAPNTIITPHIAGHDRSLGDDTLALFLANLARFVRGEPLANVANFERGY